MKNSRKCTKDTRDEVNGEVEEVTRNARHTPETRRWHWVAPTTLTCSPSVSSHFTNCWVSLCTSWRQFQLFSLLHSLIFWPFRVFLVEIQNAKMGLLRCHLYTHRRLQQTAVICKRCNCNKKRTIKTDSWKLFVRDFNQRLNKTRFTVLPYRFACILIYRHFELLWTLPRTTPLPPTGRKNSMIDASADTSRMAWVWIVVLPIFGVDGLMYTTLRWSHNDFSMLHQCFQTWERSTNSVCIDNIRIPSCNVRNPCLQAYPFWYKFLHLDHVRSGIHDIQDLARNDRRSLPKCFLMHQFFKLWTRNIISGAFPKLGP